MENKKLKIGIVLNTAWNIFNFRMGLIKAFLETGHQVFAIAPKDDFVPKLEEAGCQFVPLQHLSRKGMNPIKELSLTYELYHIYKYNNLDIVLQYTIKPNIYGCLAAKMSKTKTISTVTGLGYSFLTEGFVNKVVKQLYKIAFKSASRVAFQNRDDQQLFEDLGLCPANKTILIKGSGINTSYFMPLPQNTESKKLIYLFVGRLLYDKGIVELLEASKQLKLSCPNTELWIVGAIDEGNPSAINKAVIEEYEALGTIKYWGASSDVRSIMQNVDIVVLPSYREGLPRVMLESLAMAKPVITTDVAGCREVVVEGENGFLVAAKDAAALSDAMLKMYNMTTEARQKMGQAGRKMALKEFDEQAIIKRYFDEIKSILNP